MADIGMIITAALTVAGSLVAGGGGGYAFLKFRVAKEEKINEEQQRDITQLNSKLTVVENNVKNILGYLKHKDPDDTWWADT